MVLHVVNGRRIDEHVKASNGFQTQTLILGVEIDALRSASDRHKMGVASPASNYDAAIAARMPSQVGLSHSFTHAHPQPATHISITSLL